MRDDVTPKVQADLAFTLTQPSPSGGGHPQMIFDMRCRGDGEIAPTLCTDHASRPSDYCPIVFDPNQMTSKTNRSNPQPGDPCHTLPATTNSPIVAESAPKCFTQNQAGDVLTGDVATVRRLVPAECLRLQGFPSDYLDIIYRGKPAADGPKYRACGNSMAVPVMRWIGERIQMIDDMP